MYFYRVEVTATTTTGAGGCFSEHAVMMRAGEQIETTSRQIHAQQFNSSLVYNATVSASQSGVISATILRPNGGENIRDVYLRVVRINTPFK
ncbi:hypothetical protein ACT3KP_11795 [Escherichia coli]|nr:hypothetical protein [Escherichia coli]HAM2585197.1 hypothetical protein [Escherichia coli]HAM2594263.1 hypothetical protein [Escherichia coli]HAM2713986.1 hypothetical protein [Escherichia coli]HAM2851322.1 hypothetical protein [Escherichia coli]